MLRNICSIIVALLLASPSLAQLPAARTSAIFPPGGSVGSSFDVQVSGNDLEDAKALTFSHPGITARLAGIDASGKPAKGLSFTVTIAKEVPIGTYDCRVAGRFGISNPRAFLVHDRRTVAAGKAGDTPATAAELPINAIAAGQSTPNAYSFWSFQAAKGQRLMIECLTRAIDSKLSPNLAVDDASGSELARSRRAGFIDFTAPADGIYTIRVSDMLYRGGAEFSYLLSASATPRLDHVFPLAGKPGSKGRFTLFGRNLPGGKPSELIASDGQALEQLEVEIELPKRPTAGQRLQSAGVVAPASVSLEGFAYRLTGNYGSSNAVPILFSDSDIIAEQEMGSADQRNDKPQQAQKLSLPAEVAGRFYPRNDRDHYTFEARKGDVYYVEIVADRLDQPVAPLVVIQKAGDGKDGKPVDVLTSPEDESNIGTPGFRTGTRDFAIRWEVKEDSVYRMLVRDRFSVSRDDGSLRYQLSVRKPSPDYQVAAVPVSTAPSETAVWSPMLRKGGSTPIRVVLFRRDDFSGDVEVWAEGLPEGVTCDPITLANDESSGVLMLTAGDKAKPWSGAIGVVAKSTVDGKEILRQARAGAIVAGTAADGKTNNNANVDLVVTRIVDDLALAVLDDPEPLVISAGDKPLEVVSGEKLTIPLSVKKTGDIKAALKLKAVGLDSVRTIREITIDPKTDKANLELDTKQVKLTPGTHTFYLASPATIKYKRPGADAAADDAKDKKKQPEEKEVATMAISGPITVKVLPAEKVEVRKSRK